MKFFIAIILLLIVGRVACRFSIEDAERMKASPLAYHEGDMVQVKLTQDIGIVVDIYDWSRQYRIRLPNYNIETFDEFELTSAAGRDMMRQSSGGKVPAAEETPNQIFNNEQVWNPQTQKYEPRSEARTH